MLTRQIYQKNSFLQAVGTSAWGVLLFSVLDDARARTFIFGRTLTIFSAASASRIRTHVKLSPWHVWIHFGHIQFAPRNIHISPRHINVRAPRHIQVFARCYCGCLVQVALPRIRGHVEVRIRSYGHSTHIHLLPWVPGVGPHCELRRFGWPNKFRLVWIIKGNSNFRFSNRRELLLRPRLSIHFVINYIN